MGNAEDLPARSGVSIVLPDWPCTAAADIRGGAPGTRETDLLNPSCLVEKVDAVTLSGGSVYGLDAASGVTAWLSAQGRGFRLGSTSLTAPIVPAAILFDLSNGGDKNWGMTPPYRALGIAGCEAAAKSFHLGNAGAGLGASAGIYKGGLGSATFWAAPFAMNQELGEHRDVSGALDPAPMAGSKLDAAPGTNTTICVVACNAILTPAQAQRIAIMAHDGFARAVRPVHTPLDGDVIFCLASGVAPLPDPEPMNLAILGGVAADCVARALARGVYEARSLGSLRGYRDVHGV